MVLRFVFIILYSFCFNSSHCSAFLSTCSSFRMRKPVKCCRMAPRQLLAFDPLHKKRNPVTGYRIPDLIKQGEIVSDITKKKWKIGKSIGVGAFGDVYLASDDISKPVGAEAKYVIKMEPHKNGPLFVEMNFYLRAAREPLITNWIAKKRIKRLGMPKLFGFGSHVIKGEKMRFIVLPKYGESIYKLFFRHSQRFHIKTVLTLGYHIMDVLEFIHSQGYIHSDIKSLNLVLGNDAPVYLIDFGLACKYQCRDGTHKEYTPDSRKADVGTLEFSGRDAHLGVISRRCDLESLGYNMISWLGGKLPWEDYLDSDLVTQLKDQAMSNVRGFLGRVFMGKQVMESSIAVLAEYLEYVSHLDFNSEPDYSYCKKLFALGMRKAGYLDDLKLTFDCHAKLKKKFHGTENLPFIQKTNKNKTTVVMCKKPCAISTSDSIISPRVTRAIEKKKTKRRKKRFDWASVLAGHPERDIKKQKSKELTPSRVHTPTRVEKTRVLQPNISNPTSAMLEVMGRRKLKDSNFPRRSSSRADSVCTLDGSYYTPAMRAVLERRNSLVDDEITPRITRSHTRASRAPTRAPSPPSRPPRCPSRASRALLRASSPSIPPRCPSRASKALLRASSPPIPPRCPSRASRALLRASSPPIPPRCPSRASKALLRASSPPIPPRCPSRASRALLRASSPPIPPRCPSRASKALLRASSPSIPPRCPSRASKALLRASSPPVPPRCPSRASRALLRASSPSIPPRCPSIPPRCPSRASKALLRASSPSIPPRCPSRASKALLRSSSPPIPPRCPSRASRALLRASSPSIPPRSPSRASKALLRASSPPIPPRCPSRASRALLRASSPPSRPLRAPSRASRAILSGPSPPTRAPRAPSRASRAPSRSSMAPSRASSPSQPRFRSCSQQRRNF